eukprot:scaffold4247_cov66-Cylindrotheca_fusiformis.AAC.26
MAMATRKTIAAFLCGFVAASITHTGFSLYFGLGKYAATSMEEDIRGQQQIYSTASPTAPILANGAVSNRTTHHKPLLTIVTGFSENHLMEGIGMLQTLIDAKYSGPLYIYLLHGPSEPLSDAMKMNFTQLIKESPLQETIVEMEVEEFSSYCFKPRIIQDYLALAAKTKPSSSPQVLLWTDTSVIFASNPVEGAKRMVRDQIDFAARIGHMGMGENTDPRTYDYLNMTKTDFIHRRELAASAFMVNLERMQGRELILTPYIDCGLRECHTCMAPVGTIKKIPEGMKFRGPPSSVYIAHRQDQSVLSLLAFQCEDQKTCNISINEKYYLPRHRGRGAKMKAFKFNY